MYDINQLPEEDRDSNNPAWLAMRMPIGIHVKINENAVINAIRRNGQLIISPYRDNNPSNSIVNTEDTKKYLGKVGVVIHQDGYTHQPSVKMDGGTVVIPMYRSDVEEVK